LLRCARLAAADHSDAVQAVCINHTKMRLSVSESSA